MPSVSDIIAVAAILISIAAVLESKRLRSEAERMRKNIKEFADAQLQLGQASSLSADRSATAAEISAKSSQESAKTANEGMRISQQAYLGTTSIEFLSNIPTVNQSLVVKVMLKNSGNSPALDLRIAYKIHFQEDVRTVRPLYPDNRQPGFDIAPGVEIPLEHILQGNVTQQNMSDLENDSRRLYAFGWARYKDIFGKEHWTKWCYEYSRFTPGRIFNIVPAYHKLEEIEE